MEPAIIPVGQRFPVIDTQRVMRLCPIVIVAFGLRNSIGDITSGAGNVLRIKDYLDILVRGIHPM